MLAVGAVLIDLAIDGAGADAGNTRESLTAVRSTSATIGRIGLNVDADTVTAYLPLRTAGCPGGLGTGGIDADLPAATLGIAGTDSSRCTPASCALARASDALLVATAIQGVETGPGVIGTGTTGPDTDLIEGVTDLTATAGGIRGTGTSSHTLATTTANRLRLLLILACGALSTATAAKAPPSGGIADLSPCALGVGVASGGPYPTKTKGTSQTAQGTPGQRLEHLAAGGPTREASGQVIEPSIIHRKSPRRHHAGSEMERKSGENRVA